MRSVKQTLRDIKYLIRQNLYYVIKQVDELAAGLLELGMKPGDRLCLMGSNSVEWEITLLASIKAGLITVRI